MVTQYEERDPIVLDEIGGYYSRHVSAMTREALHEKTDIAAELAVRDCIIDELKENCKSITSKHDALVAQRDELLDALESASAKMKKAHSDMFDQCLSNPIKNAWGKPVDVSSINDLQLESSRADRLIAKSKVGAA